LIARYAENTGRDLSAIGWYEVLACFKLGIILEGTYARAFSGEAPSEVGDRLHSLALGLFVRANERLTSV
jgi:aminoglycoside phosphotransferase (APT) family kinase protein